MGFIDPEIIESIDFKVISEIEVDKNDIKGYFVDAPYFVKFGDYIDKNKIENYYKLRKLIEDPYNIEFIDFSFPDIGRVVEKTKGYING